MSENQSKTRNPDESRSPYCLATAWLAFGILLLATAGAAQAQFAWPAKYVCGFETGNVPFLNNNNPFPSAYEDVKPGNYATVLNILNLSPVTQNVTFVASRLGQAVPVTSLPVPAFTSLPVGCPVIAGAIQPTPAGSFTEGFLTAVTASSDFVVDVVYTFESQNGFETHQIYSADGGVTIEHRQLLSEVTEPMSSTYAYQISAASGAGGLGLGVSIDVERIAPISLTESSFDSMTNLPAD